MSDRAKIAFAICFLIAAIVVPVMVLLSVWYYYNFSAGVIWASIVFVLFGTGAIVTLFQVKDLTAFTSSLPYLFATIYAFLPDVIIGPFDDGAILGVGAVLSFILENRRNPNVPKWTFVFPLLALLYIFIGGFLPGPFDEIVVGALMYIAYIFVNAWSNKAQQMRIPKILDGSND